MGGVLRISEEPRSVWLPQGWIFDAALRALGREVDDPELAAELEAAQVEEGGGFKDLTALDADRFREIADAARRAVDATIAEGPRPGAEPSGFARQVWGQSLLAALLALDPRADDGAEDHEGRLVISDHDTWRAPAPAQRLALEHLAASLRFPDRPAAERLLAGRQTGVADVSDLDATAYQRMIPALKWMTMRYAPAQVLEADAEALTRTVWPPLAELAQRMNADPRAESR
jgi:hypothetical protein